MKHNYEKSKFLEILSDSPFISLASKKAGISRATIYRWMKDIPDFRREVSKAMQAGNSQVGEIAEMGLVKKIKEGNFNAIKYFLTHNNPKYALKRSIDPPPLLVHKHGDSEPCELCIRVEIEKQVKRKVMVQEINKELERLSNPKTAADRKESKELMNRIVEMGKADRIKEKEEKWLEGII